MTERDEQLELKKRARRRLVGAAAFALLAVIVLPMVMDETPPPSTSQVQIRIPGQDAALPPVSAAKPAAPAPAPQVAAADEKPAADAAPEASKSAAAGGDSQGKDLGQREPARQAAATAPPVPAKPAETAKATTKSDGDRAAAILQGKDAPVQHVVLIGAFADASNVKTLQRKLSELGIKTYTEALDSPTGRKTRVRAGPFPTREAAERARDRMKRIGVNGVVATKS